MSMYWCGDRDLGLVLLGKDAEFFWKKYAELNPDQFADCEDEDAFEDKLEQMMEDGTPMFRYGECAGDTSCTKMFYVSTLNEDYECSIVRLMEDKYERISPNEMPIVFIPSERALSTNSILKHGFYTNFDKIVDEFEKKLSAYLPDEFHIDVEIVDLLSACYA